MYLFKYICLAYTECIPINYILFDQIPLYLTALHSIILKITWKIYM